jgi:hypothetical protein
MAMANFKMDSNRDETLSLPNRDDVYATVNDNSRFQFINLHGPKLLAVVGLDPGLTNGIEARRSAWPRLS